MPDGFGLDFSEFDELIKKFEQLGIGESEIAETVLNAVSEDAKTAFASKIPRSKDGDDHAADHVVVSDTRTSRRGNKYRIVAAAEKSGKNLKYDKYSYLYYVDKGTSKMPAHPFLDSAQRAVETAIKPKMAKTLREELERRLK